MLKCPVCGFDNEDGVLFCEQCKTDLSTVLPVPSAPPPDIFPSDPIPLVGDSSLPMAALVEDNLAIPLAEGSPWAAPEIVADAPLVSAEPTKGDPEPAQPTSSNGFGPDAKPKLVVIRGLKIGAEYPIYPDLNYIGRFDEKAVDIDLEDQEPPDQTWSSRQHAVIQFDDQQGIMTIEDLKSLNNTYVNRSRIEPGVKKQLFVGDVIQIGTVHFKVKL